MKRHKLSNQQITWGKTIFLTACAIIVVAAIFVNIKTIAGGFSRVFHALMPIICGIIIAYVMCPILNLIERKWLIPSYRKRGINVMERENERYFKSMRRISVTLTMLLLILIIVLLCLVIIPQVISSVQSIIVNINTYVSNVQNFFDNLSSPNQYAHEKTNELVQNIMDGIQNFIDNTLKPNLGDYIDKTISGIRSVVTAVFNFIVGIVVSFYLLYSKDVFVGQAKKIIYATMKENRANQFISDMRYVHTTFTNYISGKILDSIIIGLLCFVGTMIIGTPYPTLVSLIVGVTNVIPFFGPYIGAVIGGILVFMIDPLQALYFLIFVLLLQQLDGNVIGPAILGDSTGLSSFWVIFSIMLFGNWWGLPGWLMGVPIFAVIYALIRRAVNRSLKRRGMPIDRHLFRNAAYFDKSVPISKDNNPEGKYMPAKRRSSFGKIVEFFRELAENRRSKTEKEGTRESGTGNESEQAKAADRPAGTEEQSEVKSGDSEDLGHSGEQK